MLGGYLPKNLDAGLETLLNLDGEIFPMENGYWTCFKIKRVMPSIHVPHGVKYSLTLHDALNRRVLGYDNAHGVKFKKRRFGAKKVSWDHKHEAETVVDYVFEDAEQLMRDFWADVNRILDAL